MTVSEFRKVFNNLPQGWLDLEEALLLVDAAQHTKYWSAPMLEIGSYYGRSSVLLGSLTAEDDQVGPDPFPRQLVCIDPWEDSFPAPNATGDQVFAAFRENIKHLKNVTYIRTLAENFDSWAPYYFCYLDGDHSYSGTITQVKVALKCRAKVIAIHDVNDSGGGVKVRDAALKLLGPWDERVNRLAVWYLKPGIEYGLKELA